MPLRELVQSLGIDLAENVTKVQVRIGQLFNFFAANFAEVSAFATSHRESGLSTVWSDDQPIWRAGHPKIGTKSVLRPQDVCHGVKSGWLSGKEHGCIDGTTYKTIAVRGPMAELERFSHQTEYHRVLAGIITGSHRVDADLVAGTLTHLTFPAVHQARDTGRLGGDFGQPERRPLGASFLSR